MLRYFRINIVVVETQQCIQLRVIVSYIKILSVAQQCFQGKFVSAIKVQIIEKGLKQIIFQIIFDLVTC